MFRKFFICSLALVLVGVVATTALAEKKMYPDPKASKKAPSNSDAKKKYPDPKASKKAPPNSDAKKKYPDPKASKKAPSNSAAKKTAPKG